MSGMKKWMVTAAALVAAAVIYTALPQTVPAVGLPAETALHGGAQTLRAGRSYAAVPASILHKVEQYPEALAFAALYDAFGAAELDMDISADVAARDVPLLLQWDKRWGYRMYGTDYMGNNGCAPTALSIVYAGLTGQSDQTPYDIAEYAVANGLYISGQGTKWELMEVGGAQLGLRVQRVWKDENAIRKALQDGKLLTVRVGAGDFTSGGHFLVVCGITADDQLEIRDPNSRTNTAQLWDFDRVMEQSTCWWSFA